MKKMILIAVLIITASTFAKAQKLEAGKTFEREINSGEKHAYDVQLKKDEALNLVVEQRGVDVVLNVYAPDGTLAADLDTPNGRQGDESLVFVAPESGNYRVEIATFDADDAKGKYFVKTMAKRAATKAERDEVQLKNDLMTLVRKYDDGDERGDKVLVASLLTDDFIAIDSDGSLLDKAAFVNGVPDTKDAAKIKITHSFSRIQVRDYGDTALLSLVDDSVVQIGDQKINDRRRFTQVLRRINGKWQIAAGFRSENKKKVEDPPIVKLDAKTLNEYVGQYQISPDLILNIESDGEKLVGYFNNEKNNNKDAMYPMGKDMFFYKGDTTRVYFVRDAAGKITEAVNKSDNGEIRAKKIK